MRSQLYPCTKNSTRFLFRDRISVRGVLQYKSHEFSSGKLRYSAKYRQIILSGTLPLFRLDASKWLLRIFIAISVQKAIGVNCAPFAGQVALAFEWYKKNEWVRI